MDTCASSRAIEFAYVASGFSRTVLRGSKMRTKIVLAAVGVLLASVPALAHHSFSAEFDANNPIKLQGTVTKMDWVNPHAWIYLDVKRADGTTEQWRIEGGTPNALFRRGFTKDSLKAGTVIVVAMPRRIGARCGLN